MTIPEYARSNFIVATVFLVLGILSIEISHRIVYGIIGLAFLETLRQIYYWDKFQKNFIRNWLSWSVSVPICWLADHEYKRTQFDFSGDKRRSGVKCQRCGKEEYDREEK